VIGIVKTAKYMRWDEAPRPYFYLPYAGNYAPRMTLHVSSRGNVFAAVRALAQGVPASDARMLRAYFDDGAMFPVKIALQIAAAAGSAGLLLALAGLYAVVASTIVRRRREIAIRLAVGAPRGVVFAGVLRQGFVLAARGTAAGLALSFSGDRLLRGFVPGAAESWLAAACAAALVIGASLLATAIPAVRAIGLDPASVLRE